MLESTSVCFALVKLDIGIDKIEYLKKSVKTKLIMMRSQPNYTRFFFYKYQYFSAQPQTDA